MYKVSKVVGLIAGIIGIILGFISTWAFIDVVGTNLAPGFADTLAIAGLFSIGSSILVIVLSSIVVLRPNWLGAIQITVGILGIVICLLLARYLILFLPFLLFIVAGILALRSRGNPS